MAATGKEQFEFLLGCFKNEFSKHVGKDSEEARLHSSWLLDLWGIECNSDGNFFGGGEYTGSSEYDKYEIRFFTYFHIGQGCLGQKELEQFLSGGRRTHGFRCPHSIESLFIMESLSKMSDEDLRLMAQHTTNFRGAWYTEIVSKLVNFFRCLRWGLENNMLRSRNEFASMLKTLSDKIAKHISKSDGKPYNLFSDNVTLSYLTSLISQRRNELPLLFHVLREACSPFRVRAMGHNCRETFQFKGKTSIVIHKIILKVRLDPSADYNSTVNDIKQEARKQAVSRTALKTFSKLLYGVVSVLREDDRTVKLQVIRYAKMFRVADPVHFLFGSDVSPVSPERIKNLVDFASVFEDCDMAAYLCMNPIKYFTADILKDLPATCVRDIFKRDDLRLPEIDVYKLIRGYVQGQKEDDMTSTCITELKVAIRFAFLTREELLGAVQDGFLQSDEFGNFFLAAALTEREKYEFQPEEIKNRFWKPLMRRSNFKVESPAPEPNWIREPQGDHMHHEVVELLQRHVTSTQQRHGAPPFKTEALDSSSGIPKIPVATQQENESSLNLSQMQTLELVMSAVMEMKQDSTLDRKHVLTLESIEKSLRELQSSISGSVGMPNFFKRRSSSVWSRSSYSSSSSYSTSSEESSSNDPTYPDPALKTPKKRPRKDPARKNETPGNAKPVEEAVERVARGAGPAGKKRKAPNARKV